MRDIKLYVPGTSFLHKMHPSTKLILYAVCFAWVLFPFPWQAKWVVLVSMFVLLWFCGITPAKYKAFVICTAPPIFTVPLLNAMWTGAEDPIILRLWGNVGIHSQGLATGLASAGTYGAAAMFTIAWLTTTQIWEVAESPTVMGANHMVGFTLGSIFRLIPETAQHCLELVDVQRTRGVRFDSGPAWDRFWKYCRVLATLIVLEFSRLQTRMHSLEARGMSDRIRPTLFILPPLPKKELWLIRASVALTIAMGAFQIWRFIQ